jgi:hypothetical protein|tara:strand:+ start:1580 stop:1756 length:177 start_codon:yes stop_codon:yes gene_type:complete
MRRDWKDILYDEIKDDEETLFFSHKLRKSKRIKDDIKRNKAKDNKGRAQGGGAINKGS